MTKTTREIEAEKNKNTINFCLIAILFFAGISFFLSMVYTDYKLKDIPHKYCYNETVLESINCTFLCQQFMFCSKDYDKECEIQKINYDNCIKNQNCYIQKEKEVCEIK